MLTVQNQFIFYLPNYVVLQVSPPKDMQTAVVAMTAGYVIRTLEEKKEFCFHCLDMLQEPPSGHFTQLLIKYLGN
jgi:hypothetical protein